MDTNTDTGMLLFNMMGSIAEYERKLINRRIYDCIKRAKEQVTLLKWQRYRDRHFTIGR